MLGLDKSYHVQKYLLGKRGLPWVCHALRAVDPIQDPIKVCKSAHRVTPW